MWIGALLTTFPVSMDGVLIILQPVRHNVIVIIIIIGDNSAKVSNVPHSIRPFS